MVTEPSVTNEAASPTELAELNRRMSLMKGVADKAKAEYDRLRQQVEEMTDPGSTFKPTIETGDPLDVAPRQVATVVHTLGKKELYVSDPALFGDWMIENYPDDTIGAPTDQFWNTLKQLMRDAGSRICGPKGETEIPGLAISTQPGYVYAKPVADMLPVLWAQYRDTIKMLEAG